MGDIDDPIYGPLTDFEYTTDEDEPVRVYPTKRPSPYHVYPRASSQTVLDAKAEDAARVTRGAKKKYNRSSNARQKKKRAAARREIQNSDETRLKQCSKNRRAKTAEGIVLSRSVVDVLRVSKPAWIGVRRIEEQKVYGVKELVEEFGMQEYKWDGRCCELVYH